MESHCDVISVLRKARIIAHRLDLKELDSWIQSELNGYQVNQEVPTYRNIRGSLKFRNPYRGWCPVNFDDNEIQVTLSTHIVRESIAEIVSFAESEKTIYVELPSSEVKKLNEWCQTPTYMDFQIWLSSESFKAIVQNIINMLLNWTLKLDELGVLGDNMQFTEEEKENAKTISQLHKVNIFGTVVNGDVVNSQIVSGDENAVNYNDLKATLDIIATVLEAEIISDEDKLKAKGILKDIMSKVEQKEKRSRIRACVNEFLNFAKAVDANVLASIITMKLLNQI